MSHSQSWKRWDQKGLANVFTEETRRDTSGVMEANKPLRINLSSNQFQSLMTFLYLMDWLNYLKRSFPKFLNMYYKT